MGNRQDVPSTARPVLPHVFHLSKAYSDSPFSKEGPSTAAVATGSLILKEKEKLKSTVWHDKTV